MKKEITKEDVENIELKNLPSLEQQKAMVGEIERLKATGLSEAEALNLVFVEEKKG